MSQNRDELEAKLMAKAEEAIQKLLDDQKPRDEIMLSDMEISVGKFGEEFLQVVMQELASNASESKPRSSPCATCEQVMRYKGQKAHM